MNQIEEKFYKKLKKFKWEVMGLKKESIRSLDELADIFSKLKITDKKEDAIEFIKDLYIGIGKKVKYDKYGMILSFAVAPNKKGKWEGKDVEISLIADGCTKYMSCTTLRDFESNGPPPTWI